MGGERTFAVGLTRYGSALIPVIALAFVSTPKSDISERRPTRAAAIVLAKVRAVLIIAHLHLRHRKAWHSNFLDPHDQSNASAP